MFISFSQKLKGLGNVRVGYRLRGKSAFIYLCIYWLLNLCWYMLLGTLWLMYGVCYVCLYLPFKGISLLCKKLELKKKIGEAYQKIIRNTSQSNNTNN